MPKRIYMIQQHHFAYDGQCFLTDSDHPSVAGQIYALYEDQCQARRIWQQLIVDGLKHEPSDAFDLFTGDGEHTATRVAEMDQQLNEQFNIQLRASVQCCLSTTAYITPQAPSSQLDLFMQQPYTLKLPVAEPLQLEHSTLTAVADYFDHDLLCQLNDQDILNFADVSGLYTYQLLSYPLTQDFFVIWLDQQHAYLNNAEDDSILWGINSQFLQQYQPKHAYDNRLWYFQQLWQNNPSLSGTLTRLVHDLHAWEMLIAQYPCIHYDPTAQRITLMLSADASAYVALNQCLRYPLFSIEKINHQQLKQLSAIDHEHQPLHDSRKTI